MGFGRVSGRASGVWQSLLSPSPLSHIYPGVVRPVGVFTPDVERLRDFLGIQLDAEQSMVGGEFLILGCPRPKGVSCPTSHGDDLAWQSPRGRLIVISVFCPVNGQGRVGGIVDPKAG